MIFILLETLKNMWLLVFGWVWKLVWYFQVAGTLSIAGWILACLLIAIGWSRYRFRHRFYMAALLVAFISLRLGYASSLQISNIRVDVTQKLVEAGETRREETAEAVEARRRIGLLDDIRFAEDTPEDRARPVRKKEKKPAEEKKKSIYELAAEGALDEDGNPVEPDSADSGEGASGEDDYAGGTVDDEDGTGDDGSVAGDGAADGAGAGQGEGAPGQEEEEGYDYKSRGKQTRDAGKVVSDKVLAQSVKKEIVVTGRVMPEKDAYRAQKLDRINLFFLRWVFWLAMLMFVYDYLSRINTTFKTLWPLPLGGRIIDYFFDKPRSARVDPGDDETVRGYLELAVRRGENFIYFGERDIAGRPEIGRFHCSSIIALPGRLWYVVCMFFWGVMENVAAVVRTGGVWARGRLENRGSSSTFHGRAWLRLRLWVAILLVKVLRGGVRLGWRARFRMDTVLRRLAWWSRLAVVRSLCEYPLLPVWLGIWRVAADGVIRRDSVVAGDAAAGAGRFGGIRRILAVVVKRVIMLVRVLRGNRVLVMSSGWIANAGVVIAAKSVVALKWVWARVIRVVSVFYAWLKADRPEIAEKIEVWKKRIARFYHGVLFRGFDVKVRKLAYDSANPPFDSDYVFESAWFDRSCFCISGEGLARDMLGSLLDFLKYRIAPRARTWQTVNIIWDLEGSVDPELLDDMLFRCRESNMRFIRFFRNRKDEPGSDLFEEKGEGILHAEDTRRLHRLARKADGMFDPRGEVMGYRERVLGEFVDIYRFFSAVDTSA